MLEVSCLGVEVYLTKKGNKGRGICGHNDDEHFESSQSSSLCGTQLSGNTLAG